MIIRGSYFTYIHSSFDTGFGMVQRLALVDILVIGLNFYPVF